MQERQGEQLAERLNVERRDVTLWGIQMRRLFELAGLTVEAMYGGRDGEPYFRRSKRLIIVGKK